MTPQTSRIERVTVYREGARVERVLSFDGGDAAAREVRFTGLPLTLDDGSLRARVEGAGADGPIAVDVRVGLEVPEVDPSLAPAEDAALDRARGTADQRRAEVTRLRQALARLDALRVTSRPALRENEPVLPIPIESRQKLLALRAAEESRLGGELAIAEAASREADQKLADAEDAAERATTSTNAREHELRKVAIVTLARKADGAGGTGGTVVLEYAVPHARWSPSYTLTLPARTNQTAPAKLGMRAFVAQRTGEDWRGVKLRLSTAKADAWAELAELPKARIGRTQPRPKRTGYREPPEGARSLYTDYDQAYGPPSAPRAATITTDEEVTTRRAALPGALPAAPPPAAAPGGGGYGGLGAPAPPRTGQAEPAREPRMAARPMRARAAGAGKARELEASLALDALDRREESRLHEEPPVAPDWSLAADTLAYGRLRLHAPGDALRGELTQVSQASVYLDAPAHLRIDVVAAIRIAFDLARVDPATLPQGCELAHAQDAYDYAYDAALPCDVVSDGAFHAIPVAEWDTETALRHVAVPRESAHVYRTLDLSSPIDAALLRGPLDVYEASPGAGEAREPTYRTTTRLPETPPRGKLEIGLGVEPAIKIARTTTFQEDTAGLLGGALALGHRVAIELRNLLPRPVTVEVRERVPVTRENDDDVKVELGAVSPAWEKWDQEQTLRGGHRWSVSLDPGATRTLSATYTIKLSSKLELVGGNRRES